MLSASGSAQIEVLSVLASMRFTRGQALHGTLADCRELAETRPHEVVANIAICLIHQANFLLIARLEQDFIREGGICERMAWVRSMQNL